MPRPPDPCFAPAWTPPRPPFHRAALNGRARGHVNSAPSQEFYHADDLEPGILAEPRFIIAGGYGFRLERGTRPLQDDQGGDRRAGRLDYVTQGAHITDGGGRIPDLDQDRLFDAGDGVHKGAHPVDRRFPGSQSPASAICQPQWSRLKLREDLVPKAQAVGTGKGQGFLEALGRARIDNRHVSEHHTVDP